MVLGCGGDGDAAHSPLPATEAGLDGAPDAVIPDSNAEASGDHDVGPDAQDGSVDLDGSPADQSVADATEDAPAADQLSPDASCQSDVTVLAQAGTTSSCSFPIPATVNHDEVNILLGGRLCEQGSHNCSDLGGWFWNGDEVALCDDTCLAWENSGANLLLEVGCPSESCTKPCSNAGGVCGNGMNYCCIGNQCDNDTCIACGRGGEACSSTNDCCSGSCEGSICVGGMGTPCVSQAGCAEGVCRNNVCQCEADQILCNSGCVSYLDPMNCRGCGNVCQAGRICTADGCVCDPQTGLPDECSGVCVNKSNDRTNCGYCFHVCPKLEQVCVNSICGCPGGQTECNGSCVDTSTSQSHCGTCNHGCPYGAEVCTGGVCDCAPGYTRCSGTCVNLLTDKYNCNACGQACSGNRTCQNGICANP